MTEPRPSFEDLGDELRSLGANLRQVLQAAWESDERRRHQEDIERGLDDLARTLRSAGQEFAASPTGQRLRDDVEGLHARLRSSDLDARLREELLAMLRRVNEELEKAAAGRSSAPPAADSEAPERAP
jgi:hypothetical protein